MINFPSTPTANQVFTIAGVSWLWDTVKWKATGASSAPPFDMTTSGTIPTGYSGVVSIHNSSGAPITVTLPASPVLGQSITVKDALGNASAFPVTITGPVDGNPNYQLVYNYGSIEVYWMGTQWGTR